MAFYDCILSRFFSQQFCSKFLNWLERIKEVIKTPVFVFLAFENKVQLGERLGRNKIFDWDAKNKYFSVVEWRCGGGNKV